MDNVCMHTYMYYIEYIWLVQISTTHDKLFIHGLTITNRVFECIFFLIWGLTIEENSNENQQCKMKKEATTAEQSDKKKKNKTK